MKELQRDFTHVQPIIVLQEDARHEATVEAAALASTKAYKETTDTWEQWLASSHAKSVRRAREKEFSKILREVEGDTDQWAVVELPGGVALATEPTTYEAMSKAMRRAQVAGTDFPRDSKVKRIKELPPQGRAPEFITAYVDASLGMSTGKEAAQVAHAYWACLKRDLPLPSEIIAVDHASFEGIKPRARVLIVDNGLTEIPRATATVLAL